MQFCSQRLAFYIKTTYFPHYIFCYISHVCHTIYGRMCLFIVYCPCECVSKQKQERTREKKTHALWPKLLALQQKDRLNGFPHYG